jgi:BNR/Asp-box repeat
MGLLGTGPAVKERHPSARFLHRLRITAALCVAALAGATAFAQTPAASAPPASKLILVRQVQVVGDLAKEPAIVEHPNGTLFVSGYGVLAGGQPQQTPRLWKSTDHGATWTAVKIAGATGNSDVSLAVAPDGTLYLVQLLFDPKAGDGVHVTIGVTRDLGATWHWTILAQDHWEDRPWVAVAPDGTAHVIWSDTRGVMHSMSRDHGATWTAAQTLYPTGGSSHLAVGPHGDVAVRVIPAHAGGSRFTAGADCILVSTDGGRTWQKRSPPAKLDWAPTDVVGSIPRWVEPLAWDAQGSLYALWTDIHGVWLAQSTDAGVTWKQIRIAAIDALSYYPYLTAQGSGELAATWFSGAADALLWHIARIRTEGHQPRIAQWSGPVTDSWTTSSETGAPVPYTAGEYLPVTFLGNGHLAVIGPIQNPKTKHLGFTWWEFRQP